MGANLGNLEGAHVADLVDLAGPIGLEVRQRQERDLVDARERVVACCAETIEIELRDILGFEDGLGRRSFDRRCGKKQPDGVPQRGLLVLRVVELDGVDAHLVFPRDRPLCRSRWVARQEKC